MKQTKPNSYFQFCLPSLDAKPKLIKGLLIFMISYLPLLFSVDSNKDLSFQIIYWLICIEFFKKKDYLFYNPFIYLDFQNQLPFV